MSKHADDDPVMVGYAASSNISFHGPKGGEELGYTWGEWRELDEKAKQEVYAEYVFSLVEIWIEEDED